MKRPTSIFHSHVDLVSYHWEAVSDRYVCNGSNVVLGVDRATWVGRVGDQN